MDKKVTIIIAMHKPYQVPGSKCYLPLHVGKEGKKGFGIQGDNTGDNISLKNPFYCELTGLYWGWKNVKTDYIGLVHYRRYFGKKKRKGEDPYRAILSDGDIGELVKKYDVILPQKRHYYIETLYTHYAHTHYAEHLDMTRTIIKDQYPEYIQAFDKTMKSRSGHMFNMYIMKKELSDEYCQWLFSILSQLEHKIDLNQYDTFQARLFGRVSELLLDVWLRQKNLVYKEVPTCFLGEIDWKRKIISFVRAKIFGKKYEKSF